MQFSGNFEGKNLILSTFWAQDPLGSKIHWPHPDRSPRSAHVAHRNFSGLGSRFWSGWNRVLKSRLPYISLNPPLEHPLELASSLLGHCASVVNYCWLLFCCFTITPNAEFSFQQQNILSFGIIIFFAKKSRPQNHLQQDGGPRDTVVLSCPLFSGHEKILLPSVPAPPINTALWCSVLLPH